MAGGKETPRQKMIGMMYLVLTAMLALNVSKQVLNAFAVVNDGLKITNKNYDEKNRAMYDAFNEAMKKDPARTKKYNDNAMQAKKLSSIICRHIDSLKILLISSTNGDPWNVADTTPLMRVDESSKGNFDISTRIMIGGKEDGSTGEARKLRLMLNSYRKQLLALLDKPSDSNSINIGLLARGGINFSGEYQPWEQYNFEEQPLASAVTTLTRLQNDVKNAETSVVQKLFQSINGHTMVVDKFVPEVIPRSNYVVLPDSFRAQIFLAASSKTKDPIIEIDSVNGHSVEKKNIPVAGGTGNYADRPGNEGPQSFAGNILVDDPEDPTGQKKLSFPFRSSYLAAKPSVVVSPSKMNVFYIGLDNPVDISAAGFANSDLTPSITIGSITKESGGGYVVRIPGTAQNNTTCNVTVSGKMPDGSRKSLGQPQVFRIKRVPDPNCYFMNKKGDMYLSKGELNSATEVQARMDNFDFELKYEVTSFQMAMTVNGNTVELKSNTNKLTTEMKNLMAKVPKNTHINVELVHVKGPADSRTIPGVNITVN